MSISTKSNNCYRKLRSVNWCNRSWRRLILTTDASPSIALHQFIQSPAKYVQQHLIKTLKYHPAEKTAVYLCNFNQQAVVIKTYRNNKLATALKSWLNNNRLINYWRAAELLQQHNIPTAKPFALLIEKQGWWVQRSYLIMEYVDGMRLDKYVKSLYAIPSSQLGNGRKPATGMLCLDPAIKSRDDGAKELRDDETNESRNDDNKASSNDKEIEYQERTDSDIINQIVTIISKLKQHRIMQRDLLPYNFIVSDGKVYLIDLDYMHRSNLCQKKFDKKLQRYIERLLNCKDLPEAFRDRLTERT